MDGLRHRHLRRLVDDAFESVDEHRLATIVEQWCGIALDRLLAKGEADLVGEYARAVPILVMSTMFGLDPEQSRAMLGHAQRVFRGQGSGGTRGAQRAARTSSPTWSPAAARRRRTT